MDVRLLGSGGWIPTDARETSCVYLRDGADVLLLAAQEPDGRDAWRVRLAGALDLPDVDVRVRYDRGATEPAMLTCGAERPAVAPQFTCVELTTLVR